jgi:alpha-methylacyl-CoA racemase
MNVRWCSTAVHPSGPLQGIKVIELEGLAAVPLCGRLLSEFGATVVRVDQPGRTPHFGTTALDLGKSSVALDLKSDTGRRALKALARHADVLIEPYRPGVMERLDLGPDDLLAHNPRLVYARLTGWGQTGAYAQTAGHDINYIAISGALSMLRRSTAGERPLPPVNLLGDFAGGSMSCTLGIALALFERESSGRGQVIDAAMLDGAAFLSSFVHRMRDIGAWSGPPGTNMLDSGAPFYDTYACKPSPGRGAEFVAVGAIEPQFYALLLEKLGLQDDPLMGSQMDSRKWPQMRERLAAVFLSRTRDEWASAFAGSDACVSPVLEMSEAPRDAHNQSRGIFSDAAEGCAPEVAAVPRLSRTPARPAGSGERPTPGQHTESVLREWLGGCSDALLSEAELEEVLRRAAK